MLCEMVAFLGIAHAPWRAPRRMKIARLFSRERIIMLARLIQQKVPIGAKVKFTLKNGREISAILIEIGRDHISLENRDGTATILTELIGAWEVLEREGEIPDQQKLDEKPSQKLIEQARPLADLESEVLKKIVEIDARFQIQLENARIELKTPDFTFPSDEIRGQQKTNAATIWDRIENRYEYAQKINELSPKFGRIQPIANDLKLLVERFPTSPGLKRHLGYFYYLLGNTSEAIKLYEEAATHSQNAHEWFNLAVLALKTGKEGLACYALEQTFHQTPIIEEQDAWYVYVGLLRKFNNYPALSRLCDRAKREPAEDEITILLETGIYLLRVTDKEQLAADLVRQWIQGQPPKSLALEAFNQLKGLPTESYQQVVSEFEKTKTEKFHLKLPQQPQGHIYIYRRDRNFGFLEDLEGNKYFFHRSAIIDETLLNRLANFMPGEQIPAVFEKAQGPKGLLAIQISLYRTIDEMFGLAVDYAESGEYSKAIAQIRQVLRLNPDYPNAKERYEKWREYARTSGVPMGSNPYARAKRVQLIEKDLERAGELLREAIAQGDNVESAIKDLAGLLTQLGRSQEAIEVLEKNRKRIQDQQSLDNILVTIYKKAEQYDRTIALLQKNLGRASNEQKRTQILWQIATCYLREEEYIKAEQTFGEVLRLRPDNMAAKRNVALCLSKQERYEEAEKLLNQILNLSPDGKAVQLLEAISQARTSGEPAYVDEIIIETTLSEFSGELSGFTQFFLSRCDFQGVAPDRIKQEEGQKRYVGSERGAQYDIERLEDIAKQLGTRRPRDRADYFLSAARISQDVSDDPNKFYRYLCRSFASRGDTAVVENRPLDAAREWYCEALTIYDGVRTRRKDEQDAVNALVRFLFSLLGSAQIPITPKIPSIDETIEEVLNQHPQREKVFDAIAHLVLRSRYAANRILNRFYYKTSLQAMAVEFLRNQNVSVPLSITRIQDFIQLWNILGRNRLDEMRTILDEFHFLNKVKLTTAWLENAIERAKSIEHRLYLDLDKQRVGQLQRIFETCLDLCKQVVFEERERLCIQIDGRCQDLLREIEDNPTKLSIEEIHSVVQSIQDEGKEYLEELYETSAPQITLRLPIESYVPDDNQWIEVQIVAANSMGSSPAESLELIVQEDESFFTLNVGEIKSEESLRGGEQRILKVPMRVMPQALQEQTFSMPVYVQYRTRSKEIEQAPVNNFSIRLYAEEDFEEIPNPYAAYAEGGIVGEPEMFYGRDELIENIAGAIEASRAQSKCIITFGQKRAGKSSILYHLRRRLEREEDLMILDLGNIGSILDEHSTFPLLYHILWTILQKLRYAIEDRQDKGCSSLNLSFPSDSDFYTHPSPLVLFKQIFDEYKRQASKREDWQRVQVVMLIDEFSYIYGQIVAGHIPELFMKNWKALLQENYFSAVLAGQDVMPKFKERFPNEFGTTQDERVTYLKPEDAIKLIDEPIRLGGRRGESRYRERAIERILELTSGSPFYIQIFCNRLVEYMNRKHARLVTEADVEQVKNELIRGVNALSLDKFDNLINSGDTSEDAISDEDTLKVLKAIALNSHSGPCHRNNITCETDSPVDVILDDLVKRDVLKREREHYYQIRIGLFRDLFREWLVANQ
ncbi:tetratricopeptide repeat protein [Dehalococcoidia bacterium]|nr:tetratricopeptide repeat protein [Dehalococcoidia bacterium]